jgi:DNA polymerase I-like protein with 3'-5' exonuclease and polymerase domains
MDFPRLSEFDTVAIDTETTGTSWYKDEMFGFAMSMGDKDYYWDIRQTPKAIDWLYDQMKIYKGYVVNHAIKFDAHFLRQMGVDISHKKLICTMVRAALINEHLFEYSLESVCQKYLKVGKDDPYHELAEMFGGKATRNVQIKNLSKAPVELAARYAKMDTRRVLELHAWQQKEIEKQELQEICSLEDAVLPVLLRMEARGIRVDVARAEENMAILEKKIKKVQAEVNALANSKFFNINSTPQIREFFKPEKIEGTHQFRLIDGTICSSTNQKKSRIDKEEGKEREDAPSIGKETLEQMIHPMAKKITELRSLIKIHGTFLRDQLLGFQQNGWIYPNFKQCGTVNGRFAASEPALQAVPKRNPEMAEITRSNFLPDEGEEILRCDFEQSDFRGFVHYTRSAPLVEAYNRDPWTDFHGIIAKLMNIPRKPQANGGANAKQINLGSIFGMGPGKLAKKMRLPYTEEVSSRGKVWLKPGVEAEEIFALYHNNVPGVADFNKKASGVARSRGYVKSIYGRHLRFPNKNFTYKAPGYLYSSFTSDLCKAAMVAVDKIGPEVKIKLQVHDEIIFSISDRKMIPHIKEAMETALGNRTDIPIRTNPEIGPNWFATKKLEG